MNKRAFTLAEVLITLTIIGVIAALTIPNLMKKYENHVLLTQLKNWYSEFSNAIGQFKAQNDNVWEVYDATISYPGLNTHSAFIDYLDEKYGDLYSSANNTSTWSTISQNLWKNKNGVIKYKTLSGGNGEGNYPDLHYYFTEYKTYRSKSGALFGIQYKKDPSRSKAWTVVVDVNGPNKGPNIVGRDTFHFYIDDTGAKLFGRYLSGSPSYWLQHKTTSNYNTYCSPESSNIYNGIICAERIMKEGWQMNY